MKKISIYFVLLLAFNFAENKSFSQSLVRGPYLQLGTSTSVIVKWRTDSPTDTKVQYGLTPGYLESVVSDPSNVINHEIEITGLEPNTKYYYSIGNSTTVLQGDSENHFITAPTIGSVKPTRIWVIGDAGRNSSQQNQVRDAYYNYTGTTPTDVWLWLGDNAYSDGTDAEYQTKVFINHYERMFKQTVSWPAAGNHDLHSANATSQTGPYYDIFTLPKNGEAGGVASGTEAYYSFNYSNIHFVCLESTTSSFRSKTGDMANWLKNDLSENKQKWTVIYFHHPPYSKGSHNSDSESQLVEMRQNIVPIAEEYNVDLVLSGHSHCYERSFFIKGHFGNESSFSNSMMINDGNGAMPAPYVKDTTSQSGTVYAVVGCSGTTGSTSNGWPHNAMSYSTNSEYGSMVIDVHGDTLNAKFINNASSPVIKDEFTIIRKSPATTTTDIKKTLLSDETKGLKIFPNPSNGIFYLTFGSDSITESEVAIEVMNSIGQNVYGKKLMVKDGVISEEIKLNSGYVPGVYIIHVTAGSNIYNAKMMIY